MDACELYVRFRGREYWARLWRGWQGRTRVTPDLCLLPLTSYRQLDRHTCGFIAALTVVHYYYPFTSDQEVLRHLRPTESFGVATDRLIKGLTELGVAVDHRCHMSFGQINTAVRHGHPVILSVWPEGAGVDHWVVCRGVDAAKRRIYLLNYRLSACCGTPWDDFQAIWYPAREGWICRKR